jgi:hypothetical protein
MSTDVGKVIWRRSMRAGDLVRFFSDESDYAGHLGIITRMYGEFAYVQWSTTGLSTPFCKYPMRQLEVVNELR